MLQKERRGRQGLSFWEICRMLILAVAILAVPSSCDPVQEGRRLRAKKKKNPKKAEKSSKSEAPSAMPSMATGMPSGLPSSDPSDAPSSTPSVSSAPSDVPSSPPSLSSRPTEVYDIAAPLCEDKSEDITFTAFRGVASDFGEDANQNGILDEGEDSNENGLLDPDSGISTVQLLNATNLLLDYSFVEGDESVTIDANRIDDAMHANGTILVTDGSGNSCVFDVILEPFDQTVFEEDNAFPAAVFTEMFPGNETNNNLFTVQGLDFEEPVVGEVYIAAHPDSCEHFYINITEILISTTDLSDDIETDPETPTDVIDFIGSNNYTSFVFVGTFTRDDVSIPLVALAFTYIEEGFGEGFSNVVIISDAEGFVPDNDEDEDVPLIEDTSRALQTYGIQSRELNGGGCQSGLDGITCPPDQVREVNGACVSAARTAFNAAVSAAQGDYDTAIQVAKAAKTTAMVAWKAKKARDFAKQLIPCVLIGVLSGPLGYALCAARALAIVIAKALAGKLAIQAVFELAKRNARLVLEAALAAACLAFQGSVRACVSCNQEPCDRNSDCNSEEYPDPHFRTWNGRRYDFHGECDMVHVSNDHLDLHIRTETRGHWSAVVRASLRFDSDILEVFEDGTVMINGAVPDTMPDALDDIYPLEISTTAASVRMSGGQFINFRFYYNSLLVRIDAHGSDFYESMGMAGKWNAFGLVGRDGNTTFADTTAFAVEWEVNETLGDPILFSHPAVHNCADPPGSGPRPEPTEEEIAHAEEVCNGVVLEGQDGREECIFDVLLTGDDTVIDNPAFVEPLVSLERCVAPESEEGPTCEDLGGTCVYRCDTLDFDCIEGAFCSENADLAVVDAERRSLRRMEFIEGCSCALPRQPSNKPSISPKPSVLPSTMPSAMPSDEPSSVPTIDTKRSKKNVKKAKAS